MRSIKVLTGDKRNQNDNNNQSIHKGDIIVFRRDNLSIVHRIVDIRNINGTVRYYTKGDANKSKDVNLVNGSQIKGKVKFIF